MEYLSKQRYDEIAAELRNLIDVVYPKVTEDLAEASAQGDRSDNAGYREARRTQAKTISRIRFLQKVLEHARVIDPDNLIKENYILAAGSWGFSRQLTAIFQSRGWQAQSLTNKRNVPRFFKELQAVPQYLVTDKLTDWVIRLCQELQSQGTQIILSGGMTESPEELKSILGVPYYNIMGLPAKVAIVLTGTQD